MRSLSMWEKLMAASTANSVPSAIPSRRKMTFWLTNPPLPKPASENRLAWAPSPMRPAHGCRPFLPEGELDDADQPPPSQAPDPPWRRLLNADVEGVIGRRFQAP